MAQVIKVKVHKVSAQPSTTSGQYIHTLKTEGKEVEIMGVKKKSGALTYFIALPQQLPVGKEDTIDLDIFNVVERPFEVTDEQTGEVQTLMLKWLHIR